MNTTIPENFPVRPLADDEPAKDRVTCGTCGRSWDDAVVTSMTPAPSARCPFESFHDDMGEFDEGPPVARDVWVAPADGEDGTAYVLLTINGKSFTLLADQATALAEKLMEAAEVES